MSFNLEGIKSGADKVTAPARAIGDAVLHTTEKAVSLQMDSCKVYNDIVFKQLKKVPEVTSLTQAGDLLWGQIEPISEFNKQMLKDWKSLITLNTEFAAAVKSAFSDTEEKPAKKPQSEPLKAAEPAAPSAATPQKTETVKKIGNGKSAARTTKTATTAK